MSKAFNKNITPRCEYCARGLVAKNTDFVICEKKGIAQRGDSCSAFKYDPISRTPQSIQVIEKFSKEDFEI